MGITGRFAGGSGAAAADVSSQTYQQMALALAEKELAIGKLKEERSEYKRKYEDLTSSLKALADGGGHGAPPPAAAAASGARAQDNKDKEDGLQDKNFPLKVHHRQGKPVVADSYGKIHEKVEDSHARRLRVRREAYHRDKSIRAAVMAELAGRAYVARSDDSSGSRPPLAAIGGGDAAAGARRTDDSSGASCARAQGSAGGQSSSASGAAAAEAEAAALEAEAAAAEAEAEAAEAEAAAAEAEAEAAEAEAAEAEAEDTAPEEPPSKKSKKTFIRKE